MYWIRKLEARLLADDYAAAAAAGCKGRTPPLDVAGHLRAGRLPLLRCAGADSRSARRRLTPSKPNIKRAWPCHHRQLQAWAEHCPENFGSRAALVGAEIARLEGRELDAERLYEQAIRSARANALLHDEAIAYERAAAFYLARGFEEIAALYLRNARHCYLRWGADGKVRKLEDMYPQLREEERAPGPTSTIGARVEHLDLATVIKVSQAALERD